MKSKHANGSLKSTCMVPISPTSEQSLYLKENRIIFLHLFSFFFLNYFLYQIITLVLEEF